MPEPLREVSLGRPLEPAEALSRWAQAIHLQSEIDHTGGQGPVEMKASRLESLEYTFDQCFPAHETLLAFWCEVRRCSWPDTSPWADVFGVAYDLCDGGPGLRLAPKDRPIIDHLRERAVREWSSRREGFAYVFQELSTKGHPEGSSPHRWTSTPMWSSSKRHIEQGVLGGWLSGTTRFATAVDLATDTPRLIFGLDANGRPVKAGIIKGFLPDTWAQMFSGHGSGRAPIPLHRLAALPDDDSGRDQTRPREAATP